jgi:protein O-GlcNAc transferase
MPKMTLAQAFDFARAQQQAGHLAEAVSLYQQVLKYDPKHGGAAYQLALISQQEGNIEQALMLASRAAAADPQKADHHALLGVLLTAQGQLDAAVAELRQAIALGASDAQVHNALGAALLWKEDLDAAAAAFRIATALAPSSGIAWNNLGNALLAGGQQDEAIEAYRQALRVQPELAMAASNLLYAMNYSARYGLEQIVEEHRKWGQTFGAAGAPTGGLTPESSVLSHRSSVQTPPLRAPAALHVNGRSPERRLRVGYVGRQLHDHPQGRLLLPLLANHDRLQFEIVAYSGAFREDAISQRLKSHCDHWRQTGALSDEQLANLIRQDRVDILVDLGAHMSNSRLLAFARKPAPVQVTWLGYPGTTGLAAMDYRLSDPYLDAPGTEDLYVERTIRLPATWWCYDAIDGGAVKESAERRVTGAEDSQLSLSTQAGAFTFGCLNNFVKVTDVTLDLWGKVLAGVEGSRIIMLAPYGSARQRVLARFSQHGIDPSRVEFSARLAHGDYLNLYNRIDLCLDSFPYNGHTTTLDALWMAVPTVTMPGLTPVSRGGLSILSNMQLHEFIAPDAEQFVRLAIERAQDRERLADLRPTLRDRMRRSPLMDAARFARDMETAYRQMWRGEGKC